jgi:hypothetical protein
MAPDHCIAVAKAANRQVVAAAVGSLARTTEIKLSRSFQWPGTQDKNLHQSPRALLPVRAGRDIGDADKSAKQIDRVNVLAYVAALDRALHECAKRFMHLGLGRLEHLLGVADERIQHRGDNLLHFDGINEQQQPGSQGLHRGQSVRELSLRCS